MIDMIREVADLYAQVEYLGAPEGATGGNAFAAGLGLAVRKLSLIYHEAGNYREEWRPVGGEDGLGSTR
ncbi:hypothetical protein [Catellatospora tritici]|uniref:hypothetical protein n=1 Tax=Catellatospora tritici TaxID=2851566 RepID=UPI001C2D17DE|nr:hypothetical protein [Catellatospora tritici]MBV1855740.1 hypothetical protein [Catellatospora tritici]